MNAILEKWKEKLLDVDRGNKLLDCTEFRQRTLKLLCPKAEMIFSSLMNEQTMKFYPVDRYVSELKIEGVRAKADKSNFVEDKDLVSALEDGMSSAEILAFNKGCETDRILEGIASYGEGVMEERGINVLFATFGMLVWKDKFDEEFTYHSPVVLLPVKLTKVGSSFKVGAAGDEAETNPTLVYKLKSDYGIALPSYAEKGFEEETLGQYFSRVRRALAKTDFVLEELCTIGIYSFLKMNMYRDLSDNEDEVLKNDNVRKILQASSREEAREVGSFETLHENDVSFEEIKNVVDADSSQLKAIARAKTGESFVLQGPPGTGKSQTITNIIAEFMSDGKKVLFVSEKLAALNVVYGNLKNAGLSDFCLELHSSMTSKREVIDELYRTLEQNKAVVSQEADAVMKDYNDEKSRLDGYCRELHTKIKSLGLTPYEVFSEVIGLSCERDVDYRFEEIGRKGENYRLNAIVALEEYIRFLSFTGYDYHTCGWYGFKMKSPDGKTSERYAKAFAAASEYTESAYEIATELNEKFGFAIENIATYDKFSAFIADFASVNVAEKSFFTGNGAKELAALTEEYLSDGEKIAAIEKEIGENYEPAVFEIDFKALSERCDGRYDRLFGRLSADFKNDVKAIRNCRKNKEGEIDLPLMRSLAGKGAERAALSEKREECGKKMLSLLRVKLGRMTDGRAKRLSEAFATISDDADTFALVAQLPAEKWKAFYARSRELAPVFKLMEKGKASYEECVSLFLKDEPDFSSLTLSSLCHRFSYYAKNIDKIVNYAAFYDLLKRLDSLSLRGFVDDCIRLRVKESELIPAFKKRYYGEWADYLLTNDKVFREFTRSRQDLAVERFSDKDKLRTKVNRAKIAAELLALKPSADFSSAGSQVALLKKEYFKKRKQMPVIRLLETMTELVQTLKPCFLMSPLSVSTLLTDKSCKFDVVIFDEASQIFPWDALGAIYRARQLIVVGDSRQMPPSDFFRAGINGGENDEDADDDVESFESVLDLCASAMPQIFLRWHYRSRSEDLIAFSNRYFYGGNLVTFPSARTAEKGFGVDFYYCENGVFSRTTKSNPTEAKAVADLVFENFRKYPERSLGVVAFGSSQQDEVIKAIAAKRKADRSFETFFDKSKPFPFFVKNLETVQGDERDVIIFSVGYGRDKDGKFYHNFGPLNRDGGERRLNVAVTRAKYNVQVVSSVKAEDFDPTKTQAKGVSYLRDYLMYAEKGMASLRARRSGEGAAVLEDIENTIARAGYTFVRNYGSSSYKIDFAVSKPKSGAFFAAVECDGETYEKSGTTSDRDRLRAQILTSLGWNYYRIWTAEWVKNPAVEKNALIVFLDAHAGKEGKIRRPKEEKTEEKPTFLDVKVPEQIKTVFPVYESADTAALLEEYRKTENFENLIMAILEKEAPIHEEFLLKRILPVFGKDKITSVVKMDFASRMKKVKKAKKVGEFYFIDLKAMIPLRRYVKGGIEREIRYVHPSELADGIYKTVLRGVGVDKTGICRTIAKLLGYARVGDNILFAIGSELDKLCGQGLIEEKNGEYFISVDEEDR